MVSYQQVEAFALTLPETTSAPSYNNSPSLKVNKKGMARLRVEMGDEIDDLTGQPYGDVLTLRLADLGVKEALLADDPTVYFTIPHLDGYASVLIRLDNFDEQEVRELLVESWMAIAPKRAIKKFQAEV
ncbi:MAG: MmcQ/YjbR family DNA-binding protein [Pseudonocardia sp.]